MIRHFSLSLTLCDPMDCSLPDSSIHGILVHGKNTGVGRHYPETPVLSPVEIVQTEQGH